MTYYEMQNCFKKQRGKFSESFYVHLTSGAVVGKIKFSYVTIEYVSWSQIRATLHFSNGIYWQGSLSC